MPDGLSGLSPCGMRNTCDTRHTRSSLGARTQGTPTSLSALRVVSAHAVSTSEGGISRDNM